MDFKKLVKPYQNDLLKSISYFVSIPSVYDKASSTSSMPYGKNVEKALQAFASFGKSHGFKVEKNKRYVELSFGKGPTVGVYGHLDVVPPISNQLFKMKKDNKYIYGRGVADDKGPLLAAVYGAIALKDKGLITNGRIVIFAGGDEERGASCLLNYAKTHKPPKYGFTPDSDFPLVYGEKGGASLFISKNIKLKNIVEIKGGTATNIVMGEATFKVSNINEIKNKLKTPHKIKGNEITFIGKSTHASTPELGKNAFLLGLKELAKLNHDALALKIAEAFLDYKGRKLNAYYRSKNLGETTYAIGIVNYKNGNLTFSVDNRRPENAKYKDIVSKILKSFNFKLVKERHGEPLLFDLKSPLVTLLMDAYKKETGDYKNKPKYCGGGTYAKEIANTVAFGPEGLGRNLHVHQEDESIDIKFLFNLMSVYAHAIYNLLNGKK